MSSSLSPFVTLKNLLTIESAFFNENWAYEFLFESFLLLKKKYLSVYEMSIFKIIKLKNN
jgi:hypothetical protein